MINNELERLGTLGHPMIIHPITPPWKNVELKKGTYVGQVSSNKNSFASFYLLHALVDTVHYRYTRPSIPHRFKPTTKYHVTHKVKPEGS